VEVKKEILKILFCGKPILTIDFSHDKDEIKKISLNVPALKKW
jgi:hypothetical protein